MNVSLLVAASFIASSGFVAYGQQGCNGGAITGVVHDSSAAIVIGAKVVLDDTNVVTTDELGRFSFRCVPTGKHHLRTTAESFGPSDNVVTVKTEGSQPLSVTLRPEELETAIEVGDESSGVDSQDGGGIAKTLNKKDLIDLADDPDDFQRQLQTLAATSGGSTGSATITVDGFQMDSRMPPKASIAFIKVNPDLFSAEYPEPPYVGGRIEVYTRPGQSRFHGDIFFNSGNTFMNAKNPFATSRAAIGKRRYGFDLSGPIRKTGSDYSLSLEHRDIDDFGVVNATTLDSSGNAVSTVQNVATPQRLWIASARFGWQLDPKNTFNGAYTANFNSLQNLGVGGTTLAEAGYDSVQAEHSIRATNITTFSPKLMHELRASIRWRTRQDTPKSTAAQLQVSGAFTSGGVTTQAQHTRETAIEFIDDVVISSGKHLIKAGVQINDYVENQQIPQGFNGTYIFGGTMAPALDASGNPISGTSVAINGLEQYRRAIFSLAGGTPTAYTLTTGTPIIDFYQLRNVLYAQDDWKVRPNLLLSAGFRYAFQTTPTTFLNFAPRAGLAWSPDKKQKWTLRSHVGLFNSRLTNDMYTEQQRLDGMYRVTKTIYSPVYRNPLSGATPVQTVRTYAPSITQTPSIEGQFGVEHEFPHKWSSQASFYLVHVWNSLRTLNINSPLNGSPTGPRPGAANLNVLQYQQSGSLGGSVLVLTVNQFSYKRVQLFAGYIRVDLKGNVDGIPSFSPQSSTTDVGERARLTAQNRDHFIGTMQFNLPTKLSLSNTLDVASGTPYNVLTGMDNNGDGVFNDRPQYAAAGTPNALQTKFGLLVASGGTGVFPRNAGTMPWTTHLDTNLSRSFVLNSHAAPDHRRTFAVNVRAANVLNHTNVTGVGNILGSSNFGKAYASDAGRRIEAGIRYSF